MNKSAVLHIPLSEYAYATGEHTLTLRIRTGREDLKKCEVCYGDRVDQEDNIRTKKLEMEKTAEDELFDYYTVNIQDRYSRICYYFVLTGQDAEVFYYYSRGICPQIGTDRTEFFQFPYIRREDMLCIPDWMNGSVMYQIFPDSFANDTEKLTPAYREIQLKEGAISKNRLGGTLKGIEQNLDYLADMGINCIYLNPVFKAGSYHKYDTIDYFEVDPCFGTKEDLKSLVKECHKKKIRVLLDGVFNHCGADFFAFQDVIKKGRESAYYDWFYEMPLPVKYEDPPNYEAFAYVKEMPKLNTGNEAVVSYLCSVGEYWIKEVDIDGWRLDVANEINHDFWRSFRRAVHHAKREAALIGEIWEDAGEWLKGDQFDSTMNYPFTYLCRDFFARESMTVSQFDSQLQKMLMRYPWPVSLVQMNLLDSHDVPRFLEYCGRDVSKLKLAMLFLMTMVGMPSVFYGDECAMTGTTEAEYRAAMCWERAGSELAEYCKQLIWIRRKEKALQTGSFLSLYRNDSSGIYVYERKHQEEKIRLLLNTGKEEWKIPGELLENDSCRELLSNENITAGTGLPAKAGMVVKFIKH